MRPLTLAMTAFGPFPGTETIRFTDLGENPLFLINGPTGSGKTTILDAICFALYGKTTGDEREGAQMRCDLAAAGILTEVTLEFELSGRRFRLRRLPEQQRPKSRGEGTTVQAPEARLIELLADGGERLIVSSKVTEATREVEELTGLSVDQFRQVMVLPQGKFRQLLMADSSERERIFSQLFQTRIYKRLEESLKALSAEIRRERERQQQLQQGILEGAEVAGAEALSQELQALRPESDLAKVKKETQEATYMSASRAYQQALNLHEAFAQLEKTQAQQAVLVAQKEAFGTRRTRLKSAEEALKLKPAFNEVARRGQELKDADRRLALALEAQEQAKARFDQAENDRQAAEQLAVPLDKSKQCVARLEEYRARVVKLAEARQALARAEWNARSAREAQQKAQALQAETIRERESAEQALVRLQQEQATLGDHQLLLKQRAGQLADRMELEALQQQLAREQIRLEEDEQRGKRLKADCESLQQQAKTLELAWHQAQAAILAAELMPGEPCPVCGSTDHPVPTHSEGPLPSQKELEAARDRLQEANRKLAAAREAYVETKGKVGQCQGQMQKLQEKLGEAATLPTSEVQKSHDLLKAQVDALLAGRRRLDELDTMVRRLKDAEGSGRQRLDQASDQVADMAAKEATDRARMESAEEELPEAYRQAGALEAAIVQAKGEAGRLEERINTSREAHKEAHGRWEGARATCQAATEAQQAAQKAQDVARKAWDTALSASPFDREETYLDALLDEPGLAALKQAIADYDNQCQRVAGALDQQQSALQDKARPDLAQVAAELRGFETERDEAVAAWQRLDARLRQLESTRQKLQTAEADLAELDRQYAVVGTLSDVANGQTGDKISLQRFVLSVLLDDVLVEASRRLALMSKGRYQLLRKEDRARGNKASGLELEVEDAYTGKVRPVATLSGGESFMAALSMALGLSDVVQAYAGGIRLDTLFIDEGFGSLDAEALDLAVRTLIDLQAAGRMVGIISHVAELKEQMPLRLDVLAGRDGSQVRLVVP